MVSKNLLKTKNNLILKLEKLAQNIMIGSTYEATVNCKVKSCKKCENGKRGHKSNRLAYYTSDKKHKVVYIRKEEIAGVKKSIKKFEEVKKVIIDIGEINFLIMKENR